MIILRSVIMEIIRACLNAVMRHRVLPCEDILGSVEDLIAGLEGLVSAERDAHVLNKQKRKFTHLAEIQLIRMLVAEG